MSMLGLNDSKEIMYFMFVVLINMVQLLKLKLYKKIRHLNKFVIIIMLFIKMFMSGLILGLIISGGRVLNGMRKFVKKSS
jgi:phosphotransferase system  glucose/maltose/N-acetylglucosamine-specific IIC component